jgi:hypothetical protein
MSREVDFADVRRRVAEFGSLATLVTVTEAGRPHTVSVEVIAGEDRLVCTVGSRTLANVSERPAVALVWTPGDGGDYQLILDGTASATGTDRDDGLDEIAVDVSMGILHRLAGRRGTGPACVALGATRI